MNRQSLKGTISPSLSALTNLNGLFLYVLSIDIFFSHCWVDIKLLGHVYSLLTGLGFRVWYDMNETGWNLDKSMIEGVGQSQVFLCCFNNCYQTRPNSMFELEQCTKRYPDKPVIALTMQNPWDASKWNPKQECKDMLKFGLLRCNNMFCEVHKVASDPAWGDPSTKDCIPADLIKELETALQPLIKILADVKCLPSLK